MGSLSILRGCSVCAGGSLGQGEERRGEQEESETDEVERTGARGHDLSKREVEMMDLRGDSVKICLLSA